MAPWRGGVIGYFDEVKEHSIHNDSSRGAAYIRRLPLRRRLGVLAAVLVLAACGGSSDGGSAEETSAREADGFEWSAECTATATDGLPTTSKVCVDSGLRPDSGGFSFANWGGPVAEDAVTVTTAVAIFGEEATCARMEGATCVPFPAVQQWIDQTNLSLEGGRCEGMAVLSQRINDQMNDPADFEPSATETFDLPKPLVPVAGSISRWWATQTLTNVLEANARAQGMEPSVIAQNIARALREKQGVTLGMYANGMGHAVTPVAVTWTESGAIEILLYDNNYPGEITTLTIDDETETWTYDVGAANAGEAGEVWTGTTGSMDYTLMADREGQQMVPWSEDDRTDSAKGSAKITVTTGGASISGVIVTLGDKVVDSRDLTSAIDGIRIFPSRGGLGTGATVEIPAGLADVKVKPVIGEVLDPNVGEIDLIFALDSPGPGSVIVRDTVDPVDTTYDDFELELSTDEDYESNVNVADDGEVEAGYAFEEESLEATLEDGQDLDIGDASEEGLIDVAITDEAGEEIYSLDFDGEADGDALVATDIDINEETGEAELNELPIEAEDLDETILDIAVRDAADAEEGDAEAGVSDTESSQPADNGDAGDGSSSTESDESPSNGQESPSPSEGDEPATTVDRDSKEDPSDDKSSTGDSMNDRASGGKGSQEANESPANSARPTEDQEAGSDTIPSED